MNNSIFFDPKSRYNNVDNNNIVFLTPNQVKDFDIGLDLSTFRSDELDDLFPFVVDTLKEMVKETTLGDMNGSEIEYIVENSDCKAYLCIEVNGKLCKLQSEECSGKSIPTSLQIKIFQRLLSEGQITLDDVACEDIDNEVYKKLVVNEISGVQVCKQKLDKIDSIVKEQQKDKSMTNRKSAVLKSL